MGWFKKKYTCVLDLNSSAPNPRYFEFIRIEVVGRNLVAEIKYPNCHNYEGIKILVFKNMTENELREKKKIDPHFSTNLDSPVVRIKPDEKGWQLAIKIAKII